MRYHDQNMPQGGGAKHRYGVESIYQSSSIHPVCITPWVCLHERVVLEAG
jgi:hypothetical protein